MFGVWRLLRIDCVFLGVCLRLFWGEWLLIWVGLDVGNWIEWFGWVWWVWD